MNEFNINADYILSSVEKSVAMIHFTNDGHILWANQLFLDMLGYELDELIGKHHSIFVPFSHRKSEEYRAFWRSFEKGQSYSSEFKRITKGHKDIWLRGSYSPLRDQDGNVFGVVKIAYDITKEKRKTLSQEQRLIALDKSNAVIEFDIHGNILIANDNFLNMMRYSLPELKGKHHSIFLKEVDKYTPEYERLWDSLKNGDCVSGEFQRVTSDGQIMWIKGSYAPIFDINGNIEKIQKLADDITDKRETSSLNQEQMKAIYRSSSVVEFDLDGRIRDVNQNFLDLMKYGRNEVVGQHHSIFVSEEEFASLEYKNLWKELGKGKFKIGEFKRFSKYGEETWIRGAYNPVMSSDGRVEKIIKFAFDVTKVKQIEHSLSEAKRVAEKATKTKSFFLANMSHEIRTPLNGILGCTNLLLDSIKGESERQLLETVVTCGDTLLTLINDILDFSKLESEKMELERVPFNLKSSIEQINQLFNNKASKKSVTLNNYFSDNVPPWVYGDVTRFRQILSNLVSNAVKFTEVGNVDVRTTCENLGEEVKIKISVSDSGIGMNAEGVERLFKSFSQVDASTTKKFGGTGLGLAICKSLTELMGGDIWVDSEEGRGSTFSFTIVTSPAEGVEEDNILPESKRFNTEIAEKYPLKIILADDNRINQLVGKKVLKKLGYRIDVAANGVELIEMMQSKKYDLILMDCHMPELDGFEATKRIIQTYGTDRPKIVALTASAMKEDRDHCLEIGMDDYLTKPLETRDLVRILKGEKEVPKLEEQLEVLINFDRESLEKQFEGGEDLLAEIIEKFSEKFTHYLTRIRGGIDSNDLSEIEIAAHTLKGSASNFLADRVVYLSSCIESMARKGEIDEIEKYYKLLEKYMNELVLELQEVSPKKAAS